MVTMVFILALVSVFPLKWAAGFAEARNTGFLACVFAAIAAPVVAVFAFRLSSGGFTGFMLAYLALTACYVVILSVPTRSYFAFAVVVLALQGAVAMALISLGVNAGKLLLGNF